MNTQGQNYSYALDSNGILLNVSSAERKQDYFCPICGQQMTPHMGKKRRWHFVHKNNSSCSYESYLHKIAKQRISEAFLSSESFYISYNAKAICNYNCPFIGYSKCRDEKQVEFDLRKYYDTCDIEVPYNNFRADILLRSSVSPNRQPILIEIKVTHECTEEKLKDGVRIIEIPIYSENQIESIVESKVFSGIRNTYSNRFGSINGKVDIEPVVFYNFDKEEQFDPRENSVYWDDVFNRKDTLVLCLDRNGKFRSFDCHCYEVESKIPEDVHYFLTNIATPFKEIFQGFSKRGVKIRNCFLCRFSKKDFYNERICVLYKKYGFPRKPSPHSALTCEHFQEDLSIEGDSKNHDVIVSGYKTYYHICKDLL